MNVEGVLLALAGLLAFWQGVREEEPGITLAGAAFFVMAQVVA